MHIMDFRRTPPEQAAEKERRAQRAQRMRGLVEKYPGLKIEDTIKLMDNWDDIAHAFQTEQKRIKYVAYMRRAGLPFKIIS